jgi:DnaJ-class molecular chaperone
MHYETLQVPPDASPETIKKQYRKMSLESHPDRPTGNAAKFKEINEAYEVLSDPNLREQYDHSLHARHGFPMHPMQGHPDMAIFEMLFGGQQFRMAPQKPPPVAAALEITLDQAFTGCSLPVEVERVVHEGRGKRVERETCYVDVFPGIDSGETILLPLKGHVGPEGQGDVRVVVTVVNASKLTRNGLDLGYTHHLSLKEALCGFSFDLEYMQSKQIKIANQTGNIISPQFKKIIPGLGMRRDNKQGALVISFCIAFPSALDEACLAALKDLLP